MNTPQSKIKVMHIVTRMNTGGVAVLITDLLSGLDSQTYDAQLITGKCAPDEEDFLWARDISLKEIRIDSMGRSLKPLMDLKAFTILIKVLRQFNPDIVHTHTSKAGLLGRIAARIATPNAKIIHTFHGHLLQGYFSIAATKFLVITERNLARLSDVLISMGNEVKKNLLHEKIGKESQFEIAFPGVRLDQPNQQNQQILKFKEDYQGQIIITFVGRLSPIKRCDRIIELARACARTGQKIHFLIIGDGELREELEIQSIGLSITFVGWQNKIEDWLGASDAAILLSDNEAVPLAMIEAGYAGLPVIATNVGSMSDVVIDGINGFLVKTDPNEIFEKTLLIAKNPGLRDLMGRNGKSLAIEHFSVQAMISKHEEIYSQLISRAN